MIDKSHPYVRQTWQDTVVRLRMMPMEQLLDVAAEAIDPRCPPPKFAIELATELRDRAKAHRNTSDR